MENNKRQTAVDYFIKEFSEILGPISTTSIQDLLIVDAVKKAKEIEREQIKNTFVNSRKTKSKCDVWNCKGDEKQYESFEQYYNETYGRQTED